RAAARGVGGGGLMGLSVLRRRTQVEQVPVTSLFWDVAAEVSAPPPAPPSPPAVPSSYATGLCWHKVHAHFDGIRYGISPQRGATPHGQLFQLATLTPCDHLSR